MFDLINGLPAHALFVHGAVVLFPLAILGAIAISIRPVWRDKYGIVVLATTFVSVAMVFFAKESGEKLEARVGDPGAHAELGGQLFLYAVPLLLLVAALVLVPRWRRLSSTVALGLAIAIVAMGSFNLWQVVLVGDSGAKAVWQDQVATK
jgi:hypothetical protein